MSQALSILALGMAAQGGGGGATYTAGDGIKIENNVISTKVVVPEIIDEVNTYTLKCVAGELIWVPETVSPSGELDGDGGFQLTGNSHVDNDRLYVED